MYTNGKLHAQSQWGSYTLHRGAKIMNRKPVYQSQGSAGQGSHLAAQDVEPAGFAQVELLAVRPWRYLQRDISDPRTQSDRARLPQQDNGRRAE